jgi:RNA polymerase sigma-70 factor (ECF subfamily)
VASRRGYAAGVHGTPQRIESHHGGPCRSAATGEESIRLLVLAAREGDRPAFDRLVELTHRDTYTLALRLTGNREDAADITQEVYLRAYRNLGSFRGDARFTTWLYRITANCASTHMRRWRRHRHDPLADDDLVIDLRCDGDPEGNAAAADLRSRLAIAIEELPPKLRAVVVLRDVYELSHEAVAEELGISSNAARVRLHRARSRLRAQLFPDLGEVSSREV